jgi:hypothetical protein
MRRGGAGEELAMAWSGWRVLATCSEEYSWDIPYDGPACYELAIGTAPWNRRIVYVGETGNLRSRLATYAKWGSHLCGYIDGYLAGPAKLYYRYYKTPTKVEARMKEARLLLAYPDLYRWNTHKYESAALALIAAAA